MNEGRSPRLARQGPGFGTRAGGGAAFTLIELLVVIAVVVILAAILLPVLSRARESGYTTVCRNNLRQLGLGLRTYVGDYGAYPIYATLHPDVPDPSQPPLLSGQVWTWYQQLAPYVGMTCTNNESGPVMPAYGVFLCPSYARAARPHHNGIFEGTYGYNGFGSGRDPESVPGLPDADNEMPNFGLGGESKPIPRNTRDYHAIKEWEVLSPSRMFALGDAGFSYGRVNHSDPNPEVFVQGKADLGTALGAHQLVSAYPHQLIPRTIRRRHGGHWVVDYCDGHVETLTTQAFTDHHDPEVLKHWNRDNLPHADALASP
ncbi:MAG TPA: DUF1559 domain-containing protein [Candidatus Acidoferrum sp.]|nr:DUF1559 domain-containing protein [Candidatus Acidoferrum sp.]